MTIKEAINTLYAAATREIETYPEDFAHRLISIVNFPAPETAWEDWTGEELMEHEKDALYTLLDVFGTWRPTANDILKEGGFGRVCPW